MIEEWPYDEWNWSQLREEVTRLVSDTERLIKERDVTARLALYVQHHGGCSWRYPDLRCTCGLSELITTIAGMKDE